MGRILGLASQMQMERLDPADTEMVRACHQTYMAAQGTDDPAGTWMSLEVFRFWLNRGWDGRPRETWLTRGPDGTVAGCFLLELPDRENQARAHLEPLLVHPALRRQGIGRALLEHAVQRASSAGRGVLTSAPWDGSPGERFARQAGGTPVQAEVRRCLDLTAMPPLAGPRADAERGAAGYSLVSWAGPVPDEYLAGAAELTTAMGDAPHSEDYEPTVWDADRIRENINGIYAQAGLRGYAVAALHTGTDAHPGTGAMAALTQTWVDPGVPGWALQGNTSVTRPHRGHRLGLLVKLAMLDKLTAAEPGITRIETWNAAANPHMIAINETLGFQVLPPSATEWELKL